MFEHRNDVNRQSDIVLSEKCMVQATKLGLCESKGDHGVELKKMLWLAVKTKHPQGNMRYRDWIFRVSSNVLKHIHFISCNNCEDTKRLVVYDECSVCHGVGCDKCDGGLRKGTVPCPTCVSTKTKYN